jgi:hypothetical protein
MVRVQDLAAVLDFTTRTPHYATAERVNDRASAHAILRYTPSVDPAPSARARDVSPLGAPARKIGVMLALQVL